MTELCPRERGRTPGREDGVLLFDRSRSLSNVGARRSAKSGGAHRLHSVPLAVIIRGGANQYGEDVNPIEVIDFRLLSAVRTGDH
jgi:hypothetical protein